MPSRAQHVRAHHRAVFEQACKVSSIGFRRPCRDRPRRLAGILGLHGEQRTDDINGGREVRLDQVLAAQPPPCDVEIDLHVMIGTTSSACHSAHRAEECNSTLQIWALVRGER